MPTQAEISRLFWKAAQSNNVAQMQTLLLNNSDVTPDLNWKNPNGMDCTPLQVACKNGQVEAVEFLLSLPQIQLVDHHHVQLNEGEAAVMDELLLACRIEAPLVVRLLLRDQRLPLPNVPAVLAAVEFNRVDTLRWILLAFPGRDSGVLDPRVEEHARAAGNGEMLRLLGDFKGNPADCLHQIRLHFCAHFVDELAADLFARVVFVSDALLVVKGNDGDGSTKERERDAKRFFRMAAKLPIELQMGLCYRAFGSGKEILLSSHSESAFKRLATEAS